MINFNQFATINKLKSFLKFHTKFHKHFIQIHRINEMIIFNRFATINKLKSFLKYMEKNSLSKH